MLKRKFDDIENTPNQPLKNSLDSDEEDDEVNEDTYNVMNEDELEGTEDGPSAPEANVGFTAFNMKEELEEGHFDRDGHYVWKKEKQIRDNWLDNIDWVQVKPDSSTKTRKNVKSSHGLADSDSDSDSDAEGDIMFDPIPLYKQILEYLRPGESVSKTLCRLGKGKKKLTTAERWKKKKESKAQEEEDPNSVSITKLTELANELLTRTGNMDIYQETYEQIKNKVEKGNKHAHPSKKEAELDMYADDFDEKEKAKLDDTVSGKTEAASEEKSLSIEENVTWDLKWSQDENAEIHGPHSSEQMHAWAKEGYFKRGAWVRRTGQQDEFFSAARVDFELYL
ncbi:CD2 antigen cytoplasmic tail-binding protein 2 homolog isoform X2 [Ooceraea biroi]|nr:CD2 antigen cytoplasmic tail-binding protein 2 homolog isoform X2 [Ooceraea biroi]XP_011335498.1 CD2 antigen cytoplasmic tail-binding protein 2 homolog isoform X2 [Ooceraea biroi]XP_011335499.1 CD2 antigen cytoplasmic tail-binding protein 2 homolog isoform X2 [Ooceraea biroi]XP_011335500.1 CD2 antigen cytoplasmic tail-binding protein 2 homolog isoform X2 [Ooceraea biroi]XP_011335501.1 CD2 antigen cytoplasmic tail-binding protein 2 homolog isoform X2 [Ooceraea biroi]XP_011335503.1 CD2 antige